MTLTKAKLKDKKGYNYIFQLENETEIEVSVSKDKEELKTLLEKHLNKAMRMDIYFNMSVNPSGSKLWLNECILLTEIKKEKTLTEMTGGIITVNKKDPNKIDISAGTGSTDTEVEFKTADEVQNTFEILNKVKCNVEKKGRFNYVSWTDCWREVKRQDPLATFKVYENESGFPCWIKKDVGGFVKVGVTINRLEHIEHYQITDYNNNTIKNPNVVEINNSIKRGMVKACAYHGLGLYVYQGEDLPEDE